MYITQEIANRIKIMAKERKMPLKKIASECGININAISEFGKGKQLSCITLAKIADCLNVSVDYLLGRTDNSSVTNTISNSHTTVNGTQANIINSSEPLDEMTDELVKAFRSLNFKDKMEIMNCVLEKIQK